MNVTKKNNIEYYKNTFILLAGKLSTQFISFLLLPLFTAKLSASNYGYVDLIQTYISLLMPILIIRFDSAVFRFLIEERKSKNQNNLEKLITTVLYSILAICIFVIIIGIILNTIFNIKYGVLIVINIIFLMISNIFLQIARGLGKNINYSISCVITTIVNLIINIILILGYNFDSSSILISSIVSNFACAIYLQFSIKINKLIKLKKYDIKLLKQLLKYSLPMIPNGLSWWIVNVSDRTLISLFINTAMNGIYSISCKFSGILNNVFAIFSMSWQETVSLHINDKDINIFINQLFNKILSIFASVSLLIIVILPFCFNIIIGSEYIESYNYIPILIYANFINIISQLIGGIYIAKKQTNKIMVTTIIAAIINIIINLIFIRKLKLYAACISTLISYVIITIYRYVDVKKYIDIKIDYKRLLSITIVFIISNCMYIYNNIYVSVINFILVLIYSLLINGEVLYEIKNIIIHKFFRKEFIDKDGKNFKRRLK